MKETCFTLLTGGIACLAIMGDSVAQARTAPPSPRQTNPATELQEIVVTAQKRVESLLDVPEAVEVLSSAQLRQQHITSITTLSETTPALDIAQAFGSPGGGAMIRGIGTQSFTNSAQGAVGIVVDGVEQGNVNISDLFDVKSIQVLEGPQVTLYGLGSSAGVIVITTNAPDPKRFATDWHLSYAHKGTAGSEFGQRTIEGMVNLPLTADSALRVAMMMDNYRGVQYNAFTHRQGLAENYAGRVRYLWKISRNLKLNVIADLQREVQHGPTGDSQLASFNYVYADPTLTAELAQCGITPGFANQARCENHPQVYSDTNYGLAVKLGYDFRGGILTSITAYRRDESGPWSNDIQAEPQEIPQIYTIGRRGAQDQFSQEFTVVSNPGEKLGYTAGLFYNSYTILGYNSPGEFSYVTFPFNPPGEVGSPDPYTETSMKQTAAYGQLTYHLTHKFSVIGGLRYTYETVTDFDSPLGLQPFAPNNVGAASLALVAHNVSGTVGVRYEINRNWTTYATATRGYVGPQAQAATAATPGALIPAEVPTSYEIGAKGMTWENRLSVAGDLFYEKVRNYQGQTCYLTPFGSLQCVPSSVNVTTKGVELNADARPLPHWQVTAGYIYDKAVYPPGYQGENPNSLVGANTTLPMGGMQLVNVPRDKFTLATEYTIPLGRLMAFVGTTADYKSKLRLGPSPDPRFVYPAHWMVGARIGVRSMNDRWSVDLYGRDLNNAHQPVTLFGGPAFVPAGVDPAFPNGAVSGVSGWIASTSLREVGISMSLRY